MTMLLIGAWSLSSYSAFAATLAPRSLQISNPNVSATALYKFSFDGFTSAILGSIDLQFCSNSPIIGQPCTAPSGFSMSGANLISQNGNTGFTIDSSSTANNVILKRVPLVSANIPSTYEFSGVVNPNAEGSYFVRATTYSTNDGTGAYTDLGGLAYSINNSFAVQATVPPILLFCVGVTISGYDCSTASGDYINFGNLTSQHAYSGQSQFMVATNAVNGYDVTIDGSTLTSGNNIINQLTGNATSNPGTSQFGLNLRANTSPVIGADPSGPGVGDATANYAVPNQFRFNKGESIAYSNNPDDYRLYTVSYLVNIPKDQAPGVYVTTLNYICLANF